MISDVGKTIASSRMNNGMVINVFNSAIDATGVVNFYDIAGLRYQMAIDSLWSAQKYRAAHFTRSFPGDSIHNYKLLVPYVPNSQYGAGGRLQALPLFEIISPTMSKTASDVYQMTFWTNMSSIALTPGGQRVYDYLNVVKFSNNALGDIEEDSSVSKVLCVAPIHWENLYQQGTGIAETRLQLTPVIQQVAITAVIMNDGYIVDFSTGGGGSAGNAMHSHTSNLDCGFAAAVFMPSASMRVQNWS